MLTKNGVDAVVLALDNELSHDHHVLGVHRPVRDPILLRQRVRGVHDEFCNNKSNFLNHNIFRKCDVYYRQFVHKVASMGTSSYC